MSIRASWRCSRADHLRRQPAAVCACDQRAELVHVPTHQRRAIGRWPRCRRAEQAKAESKLAISAKTDEKSLAAYENLQQQFDNIHEHIYATRENVSSSNEAIDELCKLVYMVTVLQPLPDRQEGADRSQDRQERSQRSSTPNGLSAEPAQAVEGRPRRPSSSAAICRSSTAPLTGRRCGSSRTARSCVLEKPDTYRMALTPLLGLSADGTNGLISLNWATSPAGRSKWCCAGGMKVAAAWGRTSRLTRSLASWRQWRLLI